MKHALCPIRIDASSADAAVRVVDTLLIDPSCLPIPIAPARTLDHAIEENVRLLADGLLSDLECLPTTRSAKHFSGRVDLLDRPRLRERVEDQIRSQLRMILEDDGAPPRRGRGGAGVGAGDDDSGGQPPAKRRRAGAPSSDSAGGANAAAPAPSGGEGSNRVGDPEKRGKESDLVRIKIRLRENNVVVLDEFDYDASSPPLPGGDPISIANGIVRDLNLPTEMAAGIAVNIVEQISGLEVEGSVVGMDRLRARRDRPAAWTVDTKEVAAAQVHVLSDHPPKMG